LFALPRVERTGGESRAQVVGPFKGKGEHRLKKWTGLC